MYLNYCAGCVQNTQIMVLIGSQCNLRRTSFQKYNKISTVILYIILDELLIYLIRYILTTIYHEYSLP